MSELKELLDSKYDQYNRISFIADDPISIPHRFTKRQDIEISGFFAALLAWGQRKTIINKCVELTQLMDNQPHDFILNHQAVDVKALLKFKHRTFNSADLQYFIQFLTFHYSHNESLESLFLPSSADADTGLALSRFHDQFCALPTFPTRTRKHIASPDRGSACKRLNMFLRWMVRSDERKVDFGLWTKINPAQLVCPCDVHVTRVAYELGLISQHKANWKLAIELTRNLAVLDPIDPVKYDFALFGLGLEQKYL